MKKKYLFITIGIIFVVFIAWGFKRQRFTCGDGVCHQKKEFEAGICPKDCGTNTLLIPDVKDSNQSQECRVIGHRMENRSQSVLALTGDHMKKMSPTILTTCIL